MKNLQKSIKVLSGRLKKHPIWLTHVISYKCNAKCEMCARWQKEHDETLELNKQECFQLIDNASRAGIVFYTLYGGEPLIYKDTPEVLSYARKRNLITVVNTNGYNLKERINDIAAYTNSLIVSIDAIGEKHDQMRKLPGLFERAAEGILLSKSKVKVSINSVITAENKDSVPDLINLSNNLKVPIFIQTMVHVPGFNDHLRLSREEEEEIYRQLLFYKKGNRLMNSTTYIQNLLNSRSSKCHSSKVYIRVEGDGSICYCNDTQWGNIRDTQLLDVFKGTEFKQHCKRMEDCNKCASACTDVSKLYNNPFYAFKIALEYLKYQR